MDAMVTARVPVEKKEKVDALLREAGATATQLVNAAYDYYLDRKSMPCTQTAQQPTQQDLADLRDFIEATSFEVCWDEETDFSYKDSVAQSAREKYESLA
ncbi:MAG: hypothetical protein RR866_02085 [Raoultibacter sp.]